MNAMWPGPLPRFRIYSRPQDYFRIATDTVLRTWNRGDDCAALERAVADRTGAGHALCTAKARLGIHLAVRSLVRPGRKVVLSPYTISDVINMVICAGAVPVFADLDAETCNIGPQQIAAVLDDETDAVMVTHLHGLACDMDPIIEMCGQRKLALIEDAAQAFGARYNGQSLGTFGDAGVFSFGMYKNVNSFFGGMIVTPHADLDAALRRQSEDFPWQELPYFLRKTASGVATDLATWPPVFRNFTFWVFRFGLLHDVSVLNNQTAVDAAPTMKTVLPESYFRRMTPMQARLVLGQLAGVEALSRRRIAAAHRYHHGLADLSAQVGLPPLREDGSHIYTYYPIQVADRNALVRHLMREGRDAAVQHLKNCASLPCFSDYARDCPNAERTANSVVLLPTWPGYTDQEIDRTIASVRRFCEAGR